MTWLMVVITVAGPIIHGEYATDDECFQAAREYVAMTKADRTDDKPPKIATCVGVPHSLPEPSDGERI